MRNRLAILVSALAVSGALMAWQKEGFKLPPPFQTPSSNNRPQVITRPNGAQLQLPAGFQIEEVMDGFERPRTMLYGPSGEILLADSVSEGSIYVLRDKNGDFKPDEKKQIITGLDRPYGMAWSKDGMLYIAETTSVKRYKYDTKAMTAGPGEELISMKDFGKGHWTRTIAFDPSGNKLYVGVGSESNVSTGEPAMRAAISVCDTNGKHCEIFASGTRNPTMIRFYPGSPVLWASVQERDGLGDDLVPDYFTHIQKGGFYGWPYSYFGPNEDPRNAGKAPDLVKKTIVPDVSLRSHTAVIDWTFYQGRMFPAKYRGGAFLALHGSWNRSARIGYSVVFVPFKDGKPTVEEPEEFLNGWMLSPQKREVWGRPTGVFEQKDGSLLVTDDGGNKIWRITYKG